MDGRNIFTITFWVKLNNSGENGIITGGGSSGTEELFIFYNGTYRIGVRSNL